MKTSEYKALCREIHRKYRVPLNLMYVDSCELADEVYFNRETKSGLFRGLDAAVADESEGGDL